MEDYAHEDVSQCCALLCMHKMERTVLGVELAGDAIKKDVKQTAVNFTDHRILFPGADRGGNASGSEELLV